jgi:hypothetical protein
MTRSVFALSLLAISASFTALAQAEEAAKFGGACAYALAAKGEVVKTDCKVVWNDDKNHAKYCFSNEEAKANFAKDVTKHTKMADDAFAKVGKTEVTGAAKEVKDGAVAAEGQKAVEAATKH